METTECFNCKEQTPYASMVFFTSCCDDNCRLKYYCLDCFDTIDADGTCCSYCKEPLSAKFVKLGNTEFKSKCSSDHAEFINDQEKEMVKYFQLLAMVEPEDYPLPIPWEELKRVEEKQIAHFRHDLKVLNSLPTRYFPQHDPWMFGVISYTFIKPAVLLFGPYQRMRIVAVPNLEYRRYPWSKMGVPGFNTQTKNQNFLMRSYQQFIQLHINYKEVEDEYTGIIQTA